MSSGKNGRIMHVILLKTVCRHKKPLIRWCDQRCRFVVYIVKSSGYILCTNKELSLPAKVSMLYIKWASLSVYLGLNTSDILIIKYHC